MLGGRDVARRAKTRANAFRINEHREILNTYGPHASDTRQVDEGVEPYEIIAFTFNEKNQAAKKWAAAVNNLGDFGTWEFLICHKVEQLPARLEELAKRSSRSSRSLTSGRSSTLGNPQLGSSGFVRGRFDNVVFARRICVSGNKPTLDELFEDGRAI